ncbi:MAG: hypothetical protein GX804_07155 [Lentisphaerae bacterium]|nr:hypothetical protein [Lentisphaerota bacterium]
MKIKKTDLNTLRELGKKYAEIASLEIQNERILRYKATNSLEIVRPVVLIDEVPWGEIKADELRNTCAPELGWIEDRLRRNLYQWNHFQVDLVIPPIFRVYKKIKYLEGIGVSVEEDQIHTPTGTYISSHAYKDQLQTEEDLEKLHPPKIMYDRESTEVDLDIARAVFDGIMEVELSGVEYLSEHIWDDISRYRGVENLLLELATRPEFMHKTAEKFTEIKEGLFTQMEEQGLFGHSPVTLHCTAGATNELPADDFDGVTARKKDMWGRCSAQIFGSVSPEMHDEFDLPYNQRLFSDCGLLYYGCCEPLERKIGYLRKRFKNLRKISITPWADCKMAAENIGSDFVLAAKPNPAFVATYPFNPAPVEKEIEQFCEACVKNNTPLEFVIKDISTIANRTENLTRWAETAERVIDRFF